MVVTFPFVAIHRAPVRQGWMELGETKERNYVVTGMPSENMSHRNRDKRNEWGETMTSTLIAIDSLRWTGQKFLLHCWSAATGSTDTTVSHLTSSFSYLRSLLSESAQCFQFRRNVLFIALYIQHFESLHWRIEFCFQVIVKSLLIFHILDIWKLSKTPLSLTI